MYSVIFSLVRVLEDRFWKKCCYCPSVIVASLGVACYSWPHVFFFLKNNCVKEKCITKCNYEFFSITLKYILQFTNSWLSNSKKNYQEPLKNKICSMLLCRAILRDHLTTQMDLNLVLTGCLSAPKMKAHSEDKIIKNRSFWYDSSPFFSTFLLFAHIWTYFSFEKVLVSLIFRRAYQKNFCPARLGAPSKKA